MLGSKFHGWFFSSLATLSLTLKRLTADSTGHLYGLTEIQGTKITKAGLGAFAVGRVFLL